MVDGMEDDDGNVEMLCSRAAAVESFTTPSGDVVLESEQGWQANADTKYVHSTAKQPCVFPVNGWVRESDMPLDALRIA